MLFPEDVGMPTGAWEGGQRAMSETIAVSAFDETKPAGRGVNTHVPHQPGARSQLRGNSKATACVCVNQWALPEVGGWREELRGQRGYSHPRGRGGLLGRGGGVANSLQ